MKHLLAALLIICATEAAVAQGISQFLGEDGVRVWHGVNLKTDSAGNIGKPAQPPQEEKQKAESDQRDTGPDRAVKIPDQPPIYKAGYRIRCREQGASSCALSDVVIDVFDQPAIRRAGGLPSTKVVLSTKTRDGVEYVFAQVIRRGVAVHQAGIRDDWRVRTHTAGVSTNRNITVKRAGVSDNRNIRVKRAGTSNRRNIRVKRAGVSNSSNIRVQ
jgi:hypothetical protein